MVISRFTFIGFLILCSGAAFGQAYPYKPLRIVVPGPGGSNSFGARIIAQGISGPLGQPVVVDDRPTNVVGGLVAKAEPDGYTLLVTGTNLLLAPLLNNATYDPIKDFAPISLVSTSPLVLFVHPSLPVTSVKELIALAKLKPGGLNYASGGLGGATHLATELFKSMGGNLNIVRVAYATSGPAINGLIGGETQMMIATATQATPHLKSNRLRALAITTAQPSSLIPGLPTIAASGLPGYESSQKSFIVAPAKTPSAIIARLNQEIVRSLNQPDAKQKFLSVSVEVHTSSPQELAAMMKSELASSSKMLKDAGVGAK